MGHMGAWGQYAWLRQSEQPQVVVEPSRTQYIVIATKIKCVV